MNKQYVKPAILVMTVQAEGHICTGSIGISDTNAYEDACSKGNSFDDDDDTGGYWQ